MSGKPFEYRVGSTMYIWRVCLKRGRIGMNRKMNFESVLLVAFAGMVVAGFTSYNKKDGGAAASASATNLKK
jgi:hypothetical protein